MAKIKWGMAITDGRGKIGGHVLSKNRSGSIVRTKVTPANAQTAAQSNVRANFTSLSQGWRGLTQAQRDAWNAAVASFQRTNVFGDLVNPSGANLYQRLNNNLLTIGEATITTPPLPSEVQAIVLTSVTNAVGAATMTAVFTGVIDANTKVKIFATAPQSAGKNFVKSEFRLIEVIEAADVTPYSIKAAYIAKFGSQGAIGQKIFVKFVPVGKATGIEGGASTASVIAAA